MIQYFSKESSLQLKEIPNLKAPNKITRICYPHNLIRKIPNSLLSAHNITLIDLSHNKLNKIEKIFHLPKLAILDLSSNLITQVPKDIVNLKSLENINLSHNKIQKIQSLRPLENLFKLRKGNLEINLEGNEVAINFDQELAQMFTYTQINESITKQKTNDIQNETTKIIEKQEPKHEEIQSYLQTSPRFAEYSRSSTNLNVQKFIKFKEQLIAFESKFELLSESGLRKSQIPTTFQEEANAVLSYIYIHKTQVEYACKEGMEIEMLVEGYENYFTKFSQKQKEIKELHKHTMNTVSHHQNIPMDFYKVWVHLYRKLREKTNWIHRQIKELVDRFAREKQIQSLMNISPDKNESAEKILQVLLFSKKKKQSSIKSENGCPECFVKDHEIEKLKEELTKINEEKDYIQQKLLEEKERSEKLLSEKQQLQAIIYQRQQTIITDIDTKISASTYQKILLSQAQGIQQVLKFKPQNIPLCSTHQGKKPIFSSNNQRLVVSQFTTAHIDTESQRPIPYFSKNDHSVKGSRRHTEISSTEKKNKLMQRKQSKEPKTTVEEVSKSQKSKQKHGSQKRTPLQPLKSVEDKNYVTEFVISEENGKAQQSQRKSHSFNDHYFIPFRSADYTRIKLNDEESYRNYMKYHLRNNIISTLNKKGRICSAERLMNGSKYQTLINSSIGKKMVESKSNTQRNGSQSMKKNQSATLRLSNGNKPITYRSLLEMTKRINQKSYIG